MTVSLRFAAITIFICAGFCIAPAQKADKKTEVVTPKSYKAPVIEASPALQAILNNAVTETLASFASKGFKPEEVAATLIDLRDTSKFQMAEVRGGARIYPASVVKMFYMTALERQLEDGKIVETQMQETSVFKSKFDRYVDQVKFALPNVKEGSIIEYSYTISTSASLLPGWQFQHSIPTIWSEYTTAIPSTFTFKKDIRGFLAITTHESKNNGAQERWVIIDAPAFKEETFMATEDDYISKITFYLTELFIPGRPLMDFTTTWNKICKNLMDDQSFGGVIRGSGYLNKYVEEITAGITDQEKRLRAIYSYVKKNVEWNETVDKIPDQSFKKVLVEKKGSSSEINLLLVSMLQKAYLKADPVLISTRAHGKIRSNPSFDQFNDVICLVTIGEKKILIDGTDKHLPLTALPSRCLNDEGLIISKEGEEWIPITTSKARTIINADFKVASTGELDGQLVITRDGHDAGAMRKSFADLGQEKYVSEAFGGKSWEIGKSNFNSVANTEEVAKESHELTIRDHASTAGDVIYINPYLIGKIDENPFKSETRQYPVDLTSAFDKFYIVKIQIPDDYAVDELPKNKVLSIPNGGGTFRYSVSQAGNTINFASQFTISKNVFLVDEYPYLRELYNQMMAKQAEQIVLKKK